MKKIAVIGAGISGLSIAHLLKEKYVVKVFEKESKPGGLIKCDVVQGNLYHKVGGHVFNSKRKDVLNWFWNFFDKECEFTKTIRNSSIYMPQGRIIGYPIENHIYMMEESMINRIIEDIFILVKGQKQEKTLNLEEFLISNFGKTLYEIYFKPYNQKIWKEELHEIPLSWLEGKLPMPKLEEIVFNNFIHAKETNMVHSSFFYPKYNGSQFLADRLAKDINIEYNSNINFIDGQASSWNIQGETFDSVIFCGNIKDLLSSLNGVDLPSYDNEISSLKYHGTTSVLCEIEDTPYSWIYLPDNNYDAHRIICTGNFASSNNASEKIKTATIEFTDFFEENDILQQIRKIPFSLKYITHTFTQYTYPIQNSDTRTIINSIKKELEKKAFFLLGRFAEWEYYNMDAAIGAAIDLSKKFN
ncbi:MAG: NAD(P)-binding protein [Tannerella sp.]|nr:NAD(P)-binding protein [Tannerella sp.]